MVEYIRRRGFRRGSFESPVHLLANGDTLGTVLFASFLVSAVRRDPTKLFAPTARHDLIAVVAGTIAALAVMALHRVLFGVAAVSWGV